MELEETTLEEFLAYLESPVGKVEPPASQPLLQTLGKINRPSDDEDRAEKKNFSERFSRQAAILIGNALRPHFAHVTPEANGKQQEAQVTLVTGKDIKLDVTGWDKNYYLRMVVSLKSIGFHDQRTGRYTKNVVNRCKELQAEAWQLRLQPNMDFVGIIFMPFAACRDGSSSSFAHAVEIFRGNGFPSYVGLYEHEEPGSLGSLKFFPVEWSPPKKGVPTDAYSLTLGQLVRRLTDDGTATVAHDRGSARG